MISPAQPASRRATVNSKRSAFASTTDKLKKPSADQKREANQRKRILILPHLGEDADADADEVSESLATRDDQSNNPSLRKCESLGRRSSSPHEHSYTPLYSLHCAEKPPERSAEPLEGEMPAENPLHVPTQQASARSRQLNRVAAAAGAAAAASKARHWLQQAEQAILAERAEDRQRHLLHNSRLLKSTLNSVRQMDPAFIETLCIAILDHVITLQ
ncbi:hypothetical protein KR222_000241 [Zaprionus bogoriensis]|nr:hypothetical protein KR222_000241 [Zaprionus bogoriensis]